MRIDAAGHAEQTLDELFLRHFQAEEEHVLFFVNGDVRCDVQGERRLTDRGPRRKHDHVGLLEAGQHFVKLVEAGGDAGIALVGSNDGFLS